MKHNGLHTALKSLRHRVGAINKSTDTQTLKEMHEEWPGVPEFPDSSPNTLYSKFQWEVAACIYRDAIEHFLIYTFSYQLTLAGNASDIDDVPSAMDAVYDNPEPMIYTDTG